MDHSKRFFTDFYMKSNGYIPSWPLGTEMDLGDLFLMRSGKMVKIGNV
jgi:hypothetical protein